jgi:hypothetical protein
MGMGTAPCHGFLIEATEENLRKLGYDFDQLKKIISDFDFKSKAAEGRAAPEVGDLEDFDTLMDYLGMELTNMELKFYGKKIETQFFKYDRENGDRYDGIEDGIYMQFSEDDLYEKTLTSTGQRMEALGSLPEETQWTNFG